MVGSTPARRAAIPIGARWFDLFGSGGGELTGRRCQWRRRDQRQAHDEARIARPGLHRHISAVLLDDDAPGEVESKAGALAERLRGEERREDPADDVLR